MQQCRAILLSLIFYSLKTVKQNKQRLATLKIHWVVKHIG